MWARSRQLWRDSRWRESGWTRARALLALGMVVGLGAVGTTAKWSRTVTAETGLFSTGSVDLTVNGASPTFSFAPMTDLGPGDASSLSGSITLRNTGEIDLAYLVDLRVDALSTAETTPGYERGDAAALADHLTLTMFAGGTSTGTTCSGGTELAAPRTLTADGADRTLLTDPRDIDASGTDDLCVTMALDDAAPRETRLAQIGVTFTINSEIR
ncbi:hypothetical protein [Dietzia lutea]|uniref:Ribosomally synthesized peptide with SipW-like signal peptide n=1 Tax=Dietzia lutea TaxID=546160 RepID=A0A2S1R9A8_9ACTN|nr:hypothetical protein [Dietzia lutea]AWH92870.1 hypothetical protein A6035_12620 [Dietzia lutea]